MPGNIVEQLKGTNAENKRIRVQSLPKEDAQLAQLARSHHAAAERNRVQSLPENEARRCRERPSDQARDQLDEI